jgi:hypothetical protein
VSRREYVVDVGRHAAGVLGVLLIACLLAACGGPTREAVRSSTTASSASTTARPATTTSVLPVQAAWTLSALPVGIGVLNDVACPSATRCYAVGGGPYGRGPGWIISSSNGGRSWQPLQTSPQSGFWALSCPTTDFCVVVGTSAGLARVEITIDGGQHWSEESPPSQFSGLRDVACTSTVTCIAVGGANNAAVQNAVARTTDGGTTWESVSPPGGIERINFVTCESNSLCLVGGASPGAACCSSSMVSLSHDAGASWSAGVVVGGPDSLVAVSCSDAQHCVGLIGSGGTNTAGLGFPIVTSDGGSTWAKVSTTVGSAVNCVTRFCVSVGGMWQSSTNTYPGRAYLSTDGGTDWSPMSVSTAQVLNAVMCISPVECVAVGGTAGGTSGVIVTYGS